MTCSGRPATAFQSTHPLRGATARAALAALHNSDFNPRTPCGVRPADTYAEAKRELISIHAPLAGCDHRRSETNQYLRDFNPRTPCGVRHCKGGSQPKDPVYFNPRTPCGVRQMRFITQPSLMNFNPRTPCGVRQRSWKDVPIKFGFQSTHPLRGATKVHQRRSSGL